MSDQAKCEEESLLHWVSEFGFGDWVSWKGRRPSALSIYGASGILLCLEIAIAIGLMAVLLSRLPSLGDGYISLRAKYTTLEAHVT